MFTVLDHLHLSLLKDFISTGSYVESISEASLVAIEILTSETLKGFYDSIILLLQIQRTCTSGYCTVVTPSRLICENDLHHEYFDDNTAEYDWSEWLTSETLLARHYHNPLNHGPKCTPSPIPSRKIPSCPIHPIQFLKEQFNFQRIEIY